MSDILMQRACRSLLVLRASKPLRGYELRLYLPHGTLLHMYPLALVKQQTQHDVMSSGGGSG